jgi:hypothetical protein
MYSTPFGHLVTLNYCGLRATQQQQRQLVQMEEAAEKCPFSFFRSIVRARRKQGCHIDHAYGVVTFLSTRHTQSNLMGLMAKNSLLNMFVPISLYSGNPGCDECIEGLGKQAGRRRRRLVGGMGCIFGHFI